MQYSVQKPEFLISRPLFRRAGAGARHSSGRDRKTSGDRPIFAVGSTNDAALVASKTISESSRLLFFHIRQKYRAFCPLADEQTAIITRERPLN